MDDPELKLLLQRTLKLSEENNRMLHSMRRSARWGTLFRLVYWLVIVGGAAVAYSYIQPYFEAVLNAYNQIQGASQTIEQRRQSFPDVNKLLEDIRGG